MKVIFLALLLFVCIYAFDVGDTVCLDEGIQFLSQPCDGLSLLEDPKFTKGTVLDKSIIECPNGKDEYIAISFDDGTKTWVLKSDLIHECAENAVNLSIYYVHQVFDTGDSFDGRWACGPTATIMALSYFGVIKPHPINTSRPTRHLNDYGWYDSSIYTSSTGYTFNRAQNDASGHPAHGAYGHCTDGGGAWAWRIQDYVTKHGLKNVFYDAPISLVNIKNAINKRHPVVLSTMLTSAGHLILVRGLTDAGDLIVNDPWGNAKAAEYGKHRNGEGVIYPYSFVGAKWAVEIFP